MPIILNQCKLVCLKIMFEKNMNSSYKEYIKCSGFQFLGLLVGGSANL